MSDKIRGAIFNALGDIEGLTLLDAFAGTGAVGFEAVSRGANSVIAIDNDAQAARTIQQNIRELGVSRQVKGIQATVLQWTSTTNEAFDIVVCDPPYDDVQTNSVMAAIERTKTGGIAVLSLPPTDELTLPEEFILLQQKSYGDATLAFYRRNS